MFTCDQPVELALKLRHPVVGRVGLRDQGQRRAASRSTASREAYAEVSRSWKNGDTIEIALPFRLHTEGFRDNPNRLAFLHGPLVLCGPGRHEAAGPRDRDRAQPVAGGLAAGAGPASTFAGSPQVFRLPGETAGASVTLEPFYKMHGNRHYVVYWDVFTPAQWQAKEAEYAAELARRKELESRTVDRVNPGEEQNERDHKLEGEKTEAGDFGNRKWRHADDGGLFRYVVKVLPDQPQELSVTYWGSDAGRRVFDILVDGKKLATERLSSTTAPSSFFDQVYPLPEDLTKGKNQVTVTFQAHPRQTAGGVFGLRFLSIKP